MKLNICTFVGLAALTSGAFAQSTVTLYGTVDISGKYVKADGQARRFSEATDGLNRSELGFRGVEDLGGGFKANFTLLSTIIGDSGTASAKFWNRRSTVGLSGPVGELRMGRDFVPTFWNTTIFDVVGNVGVGASSNVAQLDPGLRMDNSIGYFLPPNLGGVYGQAMVTAGEGGTTGDKPARYIGGRVGYSAGPVNVALAASSIRFVTASVQGSTGLTGANPGATAAPGTTQRTFNVGGSWNFGVAKITGYFDRNEFQSAHENIGNIGLLVPFGVSEVHVGYDRSKFNNLANLSTTVDQIKASYVYNFSKRTAVFATVSRLDNKNRSNLTLNGATGQTVLGGKSQGAEFGIRHFF